MVYTYSLTPLGIALALILAVCVAVPMVCLRFTTKGTLNQRLRTPE